MVNQIKTPWVKIVRLLTERKLKNVRRLESGRGIGSILLNPNDVLVALNRNNSEGFTVNEASKILSVTATSVRVLIQNGLIESSKRLTLTRNLVRDLITEEDLNAFREKYVSAGEIGKLIGLVAREVLKKCERHDIHPAFDLPGSSSRYYLRSEIPWI